MSQPPRTLLIREADCLATQDDQAHEWRGASVWCRGGFIERILAPGENLEPWEAQADNVIDARHHVVVPGLVDRKSTRLNSSH